MSEKFENVNEAYKLLEKLGASPKLLLHVKLVGEAAEMIIERLLKLNVPFDEDFVRLGVAFHDTGKIFFPEELFNKGSQHEAEGEKLLLNNGFSKKIARVCQSHGKWQTMECSFEEYLIALADKIWKGKRVDTLENIVINNVAKLISQDRWQVFVELDSCFENIASKGDSRLLRSQVN